MDLDLVQMSDGETIVCKIFDYNKQQHDQKKKAKKPKKQQLKEIKFKPDIAEHDIQVKLKNVAKFLERGDKVKFTVVFHGRRIARPEDGIELLKKVKDKLGECVNIESEPNMNGRMMHMIVSPKSKK